VPLVGKVVPGHPALALAHGKPTFDIQFYELGVDVARHAWDSDRGSDAEGRRARQGDG
jgi:hypothetical protein